MCLVVGEEYDFIEFVIEFVNVVYSWVDMVECCGEFVVCGGIVDVFLLVLEYLVCIDFFGDEIEEMIFFVVVD